MSSGTRRPWRLWVLALLLAPSISCRELQRTAPENVGLSSDRLADIREMLEAHTRQELLAGAVALVARRGRIALLETVGAADRETGMPMRSDTIFRIASMTKPITSVAVFMLEEEGHLSISDPVSKYIPQFANPRVAVRSPAAGNNAGWIPVLAEREITIRDLLTHTSGITYGFWNREYLADLYRAAGVSDGLVETPGTIAENVRRLAALPLKHHPGSAWEYGLSTDVLGRVIEVASGLTLDRFFRERIFKPLGMKDTAFRLPATKVPRLAALYRPAGEDRKIERVPRGRVEHGSLVYSATYPHSGGGYFSGGAGLVSTATDYGRFLQMLLNGGTFGGVRLLRPETVARMTRNQVGDLRVWIDAHGDGFGFGFGVVTEEAPDSNLGSPGTFSWGGLFYTYFWVDPKEELFGIFLSQIYPWNHLNIWDEFRRLTYAAIE